jgi:hypothetical protein
MENKEIEIQLGIEPRSSKFRSDALAIELGELLALEQIDTQLDLRAQYVIITMYMYISVSTIPTILDSLARYCCCDFLISMLLFQ